MTGSDSPLAAHRHVSWIDAATLPLCLLTPDMQNRRILDLHFHQAGAEVHAVVETNSLITVWSHLRMGGLSTVVPESFLLLLGELKGLVALPLTDPAPTHLIGLVASDREPLPPIAHAFLEAAGKLELQARINRTLQAAMARAATA